MEETSRNSQAQSAHELPAALRWRLCPDCGKTRIQGPRVRCEKCEIALERRKPGVELPYQIPPRYQAARIDDLPSGLAATYANLPSDVGMYLWGLPGVGKTHATCAFLMDRWFAGYKIDRCVWETLLLEMRGTFGVGNKGSEIKKLDPFMWIEVLAIEDIGTTVSPGQVETDFSLRTLLVLLDHRVEHCLPTFITSNKPLEEIARSFDARIASRIMQVCKVIELTGPDRRRQSLNAN